MNNIGEKIRSARKKKGLSQEDLAENAKVNLRTIQRIENNENEPRGKTLHLICSVLELNTTDILDYGKKTDTNFLIFFHLSVLIGLLIPLGNIFIPFILWLTQKDKIIGLKNTGVNLINFQIAWTLIISVTLITGAILKITHTSLGAITGNIILMYPWLFLYIINIILPIYFAILTRNRKAGNFYPVLFKLIK